LVKLPPRIVDQDTSKQYQVFPTYQRKKYLLAQKYLESAAISIKYCTENFTNVFGSNTYLKDISREYAEKIWKEEVIVPPFKDVDEFTNDILEGMIARRENLENLIKNKKIKRIDVLFKKDPINMPQEEKQRIITAINLCSKNDMILQIKWFILNNHKDLQDAWPFQDPSMALIVGNSGSDFTVGLCHASQANDKSSVRFQWVHKDTFFANNRLAWFTRAWDLAEDYLINL
jgi:hypothetical protein